MKGNITVSKKTFTANDFDPPNNTAANATVTNIANNNAFGEKKVVFKNNAPKVQSSKLYNNKYVNASTQITNNKIFAFIAVLVFKLLSCDFWYRKDNINY